MHPFPRLVAHFVLLLLFNAMSSGILFSSPTLPNRLATPTSLSLFALIDPLDHTVVTQNEIVIKGYQRYRGVVAINGRKIKPRVDGRFHYPVNLAIGPNIIYVATRLPNQPSPSVLIRKIYRIPDQSAPQLITELVGISMGPSTISRPISRLDVANVLSVLYPPPTSYDDARGWSDVPSVDLKSVTHVVVNGWMDGLGDRFEPSMPITQLELLTMARRINPSLPKPTTIKKSWVAAYEQLAVKMGFRSSTPHFQPNATVSLPMLHRWIHALSPKLTAVMIPSETIWVDRAKLATTLAVLIPDVSPSNTGIDSSKGQTPSNPIPIQPAVPTSSIQIDLEGHWLKDTVSKLVAAGALAGWVGESPMLIDRSFLKSSVTRAELLALLSGISRSPIERLSNTLFRSSDKGVGIANRRLTKVETIMVLSRWAPLPCSPSQNRVVQGLPVQHWAVPAITCAMDVGWISPQTIVYPRSLITKAELLSIVVKIPAVYRAVTP